MTWVGTIAWCFCTTFKDDNVRFTRSGRQIMASGDFEAHSEAPCIWDCKELFACSYSRSTYASAALQNHVADRMVQAQLSTGFL